MVTVRPVERRDADSWAAMRHALWPEASLEELQREVRAFFDGQSRFVTAAFIAADDDAPIGFIELNLRPYAEGCESSPVPHIEGWYVVAASRRKGVGRKLVAAAEAWALSRGFTELTSDTTDAYPLSLAAHAASGFEEVERLIALRKRLGDR
jgi:aminoglycoside 6'-N-acetyltransferase I